jgi:hypothetical protein
MTPIEAFRYLFERAYWWISRHSIYQIRRGEVGKPGELVERMSAEERKALKNLTSDQLAEGKVFKTDIVLTAEGKFLSAKESADEMIRDAKLNFDKQIVKEDPRANRKKY